MKAVKLIKTFFAFLFIVFAVLQFNDPDSVMWIAIYASAASLIMLDISGWNMRKIYLIAIGLFTLISIQYIQGVITFFSSPSLNELAGSMKVSKPYIEETREFFGLMLINVSFGFIHLISKRRNHNRKIS